MVHGSTITLPKDPGYTDHRDAQERLRATREWLYQRERELGFIDAPPTAPGKDTKH